MDPGTLRMLAIALIAVLALLAVVLVLAIRMLGRLSTRIETTLLHFRDETTATLRQANITLEQVEHVARSSDQLLRDELTPTLEVTRTTLAYLETSARGLSQSVDSIQRIVRGVAAVSAPGVLAVVTQSVYKRGGKLGLIALGLGAGLKALLRNESKRDRPIARR